MSDTRLSITPGWGPSHRRWGFQDMTPKMQAREHGPHRRGHRFNKNGKNSTYNLERKIDRLREEEALDQGAG